VRHFISRTFEERAPGSSRRCSTRPGLAWRPSLVGVVGRCDRKSGPFHAGVMTVTRPSRWGYGSLVQRASVWRRSWRQWPEFSPRRDCHPRRPWQPGRSRRCASRPRPDPGRCADAGYGFGVPCPRGRAESRPTRRQPADPLTPHGRGTTPGPRAQRVLLALVKWIDPDGRSASMGPNTHKSTGCNRLPV
jgi:hypothetical protein